ncbi:uncharacterized protein YukE [Streptomyces achromogenes]|uniref:Uncharacterized protein YukE n=1 Tax=Streptomyces achromogenes TaxID=67255 RepID=A0ABU0PZ22_STRAH|nr:hypothetical protein [Streptomyces achromogenes]MDQ0683660.1 uncharacterized protein YukE [Streptomyces achromogenes]
MAHTFEELVNMQTAADEAHAQVVELGKSYGPPSQDGGWNEEQVAAYDEAWKRWRDLAAEAQAAVTGYAREQGEARHQVEAEVRKTVRHPELATPAE